MTVLPPVQARGKVFAGIAYFPVHPKADMHGLVRLVIRTRSSLFVSTALASFRIKSSPSMWDMGIWSESKSAAEQTATATEYGRLLACSLVEAYLSPEKYAVVPRGMKNWLTNHKVSDVLRGSG